MVCIEGVDVGRVKVHRTKAMVVPEVIITTTAGAARDEMKIIERAIQHGHATTNNTTADTSLLDLAHRHWWRDDLLALEVFAHLPNGAVGEATVDDAQARVGRLRGGASRLVAGATVLSGQHLPFGLRFFPMQKLRQARAELLEDIVVVEATDAVINLPLDVAADVVQVRLRSRHQLRTRIWSMKQF